jgi:hypothetical protein
MYNKTQNLCLNITHLFFEKKIDGAKGKQGNKKRKQYFCFVYNNDPLLI